MIWLIMITALAVSLMVACAATRFILGVLIGRMMAAGPILPHDPEKAAQDGAAHPPVVRLAH